MKNSTRYILYGIFSTLFLSVLIAIFVGYGRQVNEQSAAFAPETASLSREEEAAKTPVQTDDRAEGYTTLIDRALTSDGVSSEQTAADLAKAFDDNEDELITALSVYSADGEKLSKLSAALVYGKSGGDLGAFEEKIVSAKNAARNRDCRTVLNEIRNAIRKYREDH